MQLHTPGIVVDYDADGDQWVVEDEATGIVAYTRDASAIYGLVTTLGQDPPSYGTRDRGDEDPHAD